MQPTFEAMPQSYSKSLKHPNVFTIYLWTHRVFKFKFQLLLYSYHQTFLRKNDQASLEIKQNQKPVLMIQTESKTCPHDSASPMFISPQPSARRGCTRREKSQNGAPEGHTRDACLYSRSSSPLS